MAEQYIPEFASLTALACRYGVGRTGLWKWRQEFDGFPEPHGVGGRGARYRIADVDTWFASLGQRRGALAKKVVH